MGVTPGMRRDLFIRQSRQEFRKEQFAELQKLLTSRDANTLLMAAGSPGALQMRPDGKTLDGGYTFTSAAWQQAANVLASGASLFLSDLSGTTGSSADNLVDGGAAIRAWNDLVELRFPRFRQKRLVLREQERLIDGVVSVSYQLLENGDLLGQLEDAMVTAAARAAFYFGTVHGRDVALWYRHTAPLFSLDGNYYGGYYFSNTEVARASLRAKLALFGPAGVCAFSPESSTGKVVHSGRTFDKRVQKAIHTVFQQEWRPAELQAAVARLKACPLGFTTGMTPAERTSHRKHLLTVLRGRGVPMVTIQDVLQRLLPTPQELAENPADIIKWAGLAYADVTNYDLYAGLLAAARNLRGVVRESVEQAAYDLFVNPIVFEGSHA